MLPVNREKNCTISGISSRLLHKLQLNKLKTETIKISPLDSFFFCTECEYAGITSINQNQRNRQIVRFFVQAGRCFSESKF